MAVVPLALLLLLPLLVAPLLLLLPLAVMRSITAAATSAPWSAKLPAAAAATRGSTQGTLSDQFYMHKSISNNILHRKLCQLFQQAINNSNNSTRPRSTR
jgi:hypothetical protein